MKNYKIKSIVIFFLLLANTLNSQTIGGAKLMVRGEAKPNTVIKVRHNSKLLLTSKSGEDGRFAIEFILPETTEFPWYGIFFSSAGKKKGAIRIYPPPVLQIKKEYIYEVQGEIQIILMPRDTSFKGDTNECWTDVDLLGNIRWHDTKKVFYYHKKKEKTLQDSTPKPLVPKIGEPAILKNTFFETDKSQLLPSSFEELNKLADYLTKNKNTTIELSGHTDNTGNEEKNKQLSTNRAKAVADYLISKGIDKQRTSYKGYGSLKAIAPNTNEENKQKNRRVDFVIKKINRL